MKKLYVSILFLLTMPHTVYSDTLTPSKAGKVDITTALKQLPQKSLKAFEDLRLVDNGDIGVRVFRVFHPVPKHNHAFSSTYLKILSGRAVFKVEDMKEFEAGAGDLVFWERGVNHQVVRIIEKPLDFLAIDTPTRREGDAQR